MRVATLTIVGLTPYSQSRAFRSEKKKEETYDDFDCRAWPEHLYVNEAGEIFIPAVALIQGFAAAASYLAKGGDLKKKGAANWAQNFLCGLAVAEGPTIGVKAKDAIPERVYCHADGRRGSGKRVYRTFPIMHKWSATVVAHILDDSIPEDIFRKVATAFGLFIGIGRYRPQNGGYLGRFTVEKCEIK
jgi:hypothetical protein